MEKPIDEIDVLASRGRTGDICWSVCDRLGNAWTKQNLWEAEPKRELRSDAYLARARYTTLAEALEAAIRARADVRRFRECSMQQLKLTFR